MVGWLSLKQALTEGKISSGRVLNTKSSTYTTNMPHTSTPQMPLRPGSSGKRLEQVSGFVGGSRVNSQWGQKKEKGKKMLPHYRLVTDKIRTDTQ